MRCTLCKDSVYTRWRLQCRCQGKDSEAKDLPPCKLLVTPGIKWQCQRGTEGMYQSRKPVSRCNNELEAMPPGSTCKGA